MTPAEMLTMVRDQTGISTTNVSDAKWYQYLNIIYHEIENAIVNGVDEDFFWDIFTSSTVANQSEYTLQANTATQEGIKKINKVEIKRASTDDYHELIDLWSAINKDNSEEYIRENTSQTKAFYEFKDGSIFIYPEPTNTVTWWLKVYAITDLIDLTSGDAETDVFPNHQNLRQYHHVLVLWTIPRFLRHKYKEETNQTIAAQNKYEQEKAKMLTYINSVYSWSHRWRLSNLNKYY